MVAYSFQPQFIMPIETKRKRQTLRDIGKRRHARAGETLQLYTGMRTRACRKIGDATCTGTILLSIDFDHRRVEYETGTAVTTPEDTDAFAQNDGFKDWTEMRNFWAKHHPGVRQWSGVMVQWHYTFVSAA